jgi:hypothetical protein
MFDETFKLGDGAKFSGYAETDAESLCGTVILCSIIHF